MLVFCVPSECALNGIPSASIGAIYTIILYIQSTKEYLIMYCLCQCTICPEETLNTPTAVQGSSNPACCYVVHV